MKLVRRVKELLASAGLASRPIGRPTGSGKADESLLERNRLMAERVAGGETLAAVGKDYGLTRERVRQICADLGVKDGSLRRGERAERIRDAADKARLAWFEAQNKRCPVCGELITRTWNGRVSTTCRSECAIIYSSTSLFRFRDPIEREKHRDRMARYYIRKPVGYTASRLRWAYERLGLPIPPELALKNEALSRATKKMWAERRARLAAEDVA